MLLKCPYCDAEFEIPNKYAIFLIFGKIKCPTCRAFFYQSPLDISMIFGLFKKLKHRKGKITNSSQAQ